MKVLICGATGIVGRGVLLKCLRDSDVNIGRRGSTHILEARDIRAAAGRQL